MEDPSLTNDEQTLLFWINIGISSFSLLGEIFMLATYYKYPALRTFAMKLVISLIVADIFYSLSTLIEPFNNSYSFCVAEGFLGQIGTMNAIFWISTISYVSYAQVYSLKISPDFLYNTVLLASIAFAIIWAIVPLIGSFTNASITYGYSLAWCSVSPQLVYIISAFGPMIIAGILCFYWGCKAFRRMDESTPKEAVIQYRSLLMYPSIMFITWVPAVVDRVYNQLTGEICFPLLGLHVLFARSQGLINALYYGKNSLTKVKQEINLKHSDVGFASKLLSGYDASSIYSPRSRDTTIQIRQDGSSGELTMDIKATTPETHFDSKFQ